MGELNSTAKMLAAALKEGIRNFEAGKIPEHQFLKAIEAAGSAAKGVRKRGDILFEPGGPLHG